MADEARTMMDRAIAAAETPDDCALRLNLERGRQGMIVIPEDVQPGELLSIIAALVNWYGSEIVPRQLRKTRIVVPPRTGLT